MALNITMPETTELKPRILVFGVGGAGGNGVNNMIDAQLEGVDFVVANTDAQALQRSKTERRVQLGASITEGLGAGARPEIGQQSAEDSIAEILEHLQGVHMCFITAGMGGGTGTGAAPVIARAAREQNILTVGVVTKPFHFEGSRRMRIADSGIEALQEHVDTLIVIPNQNLFRIATEKTTFAEAFGMADQVLHSGVRGITDLMVMPGLINLDFADVRTVMNEMGKAMMGTGEASGERRSVEAAHAAINNPLLDDVSLKGARGVLINITGGMDMTLYEVDEAANEIRNEVDPDANIIVGSTFDESLEGSVRVSVVATGIDAEADAINPRNANPNVMTASKAREALRSPQRETVTPIVRRRVEAAMAPTDERIAASASAAAPQPVSTEAVARSLDAAPEPEPEMDAHHETVADASMPSAGDMLSGPAAKPAVLRVQERLAEAAPDLRSASSAEVRTPVRAEAEPPRRGLSIFGRRKSAKPEPAAQAPEPAPAPIPAPAQTRAAPAPATAAPDAQSPDLFGGEFDESELEIPAFLRRQAN
ncbi:MAG: cell division protein FtsZ [Pseudomonadota bacterium]